MFDHDKNFILIIEKIAEVQRSLLWNVAKKNTLSPIQIQIIQFLSIREAVDTSIKIISDYFNLSAPTISGSVKSLLDKKYVYMHDCTSDRRIHCYKLTPNGKKMVSELEIWKEPLLSLFNNFSYEDKNCVERNLYKLVYQLKEKGLISGLYFCRECRHFSNSDSNTCSLRNITFTDDLLPLNCDDFQENQSN